MTTTSHPNSTASETDICFDAGGKLLGRSAEVACPACHHNLFIGELESCQFAGCAKCGGMLFQQIVFASLLQRLRACSSTSNIPKPINFDDLKVSRSCPSCENVFETHAYGGAGNAVIDTCIGCQLIWLDQGEFNKLVHAAGKR